MIDKGSLDNIFPNWTVKKLIGSGSYGKVYELERVEHDAVYRSAMKVITIPQDDSEIRSRLAEGETRESVAAYYDGVVRSFLNENRLMAELKGNSNIVSYEDHQIVKHENGIGYDILIRMELLDPFTDYMGSNRITEDTVIKLGIDICKALELCDEINVIHRDIKPGNIFVSRSGDFKLGDFGIARTIDRTSGGLSKKGTYRYMAPEVYRGEIYGKTVDICSLGLVMYYLMNGNRMPFFPNAPAPVEFSDEENGLMRRMKGEKIPPPRDASPAVAAVILKACAFEPTERYQSAEEMRRDLEALKTGAPKDTAETDDEMTTGTWSPLVSQRADQGSGADAIGAVGHLEGKSSVGTEIGRKKPGLIIAAIALAVVLIGGVSAFVMMGGPEEEKADDAGSDQTESGIVITDHEGIEVLNADIDWDSSYKNKDDGYYHADIILYVMNDSDGPVTGMDIQTDYHMGERIVNTGGGADDETIRVDGYINAGEESVMAGSINVPKEIRDNGVKAGKKGKSDWQPDLRTIAVIDAYTNPAIKDYRIPTGQIDGQKDDDHYDVRIDNPNSVAVNQSAVLISISRIKGKLEEADATGRLKEYIPPDTYDFEVKNAFNDPHFWVESNDDLKIYVIDRDYYRNAT